MTQRTEGGNRGRLKLSKEVIDRLKKKAEKDERELLVMDSEVIGLGARAFPSGKTSYFVQYRLPAAGRAQNARRLTITGQPGIVLTVEQARIEARKVLGDVARGGDPRFDRATKNKGATIADVAKDFLEDRAKRLKERTVIEYRRLFDATILPAFGPRMLGSVSRADMQRLQTSLAKTPAVANNVLAIVGALFNFASDSEQYDGKNPCSRIKKLPLPTRKKSLRREDYAALGVALTRALSEGLPVPARLHAQKRGMSRARRAKLTGRTRGPYKRTADVTTSPANPASVNALRFLALSGWREQEALSLNENAVDFHRGVAILEDSKTGRSVRPLGARALDVLRETPRESGNPFFFPGLKQGTHLQDANRVWIAAKASASIECRLHDLRHSFTTVGRELGYSDFVIARLVGHTIDGMTGRYGDVPDETVALAANAIAETIGRRLDGESASVLSLADRRARQPA